MFSAAAFVARGLCSVFGNNMLPCVFCEKGLVKYNATWAVEHTCEQTENNYYFKWRQKQEISTHQKIIKDRHQYLYQQNGNFLFKFGAHGI
jgi:hypothetical protein